MFDKCNLNCEFCFEANKTKVIDVDYIKSLPNVFYNQVTSQKRPDIEIVEITLMGGEVFNDMLSDDLFDVYRDVCNQTYQLFKRDYPKISVEFNWLSNGVFAKRSRVDNLLTQTNSSISFSYDCVGRYPSDKQRRMMLDNVKYYSERHLLNAILITPTKKSIIQYTSGQSDIDYLSKYCDTLDLSYYIPGYNYQQLNPDDDQIFEFYKWIIDNRIFQFKDIREILKPFRADFHPKMQIYKTCNCDNLVTVTRNGATNICVKINSPLSLQKFYGSFVNKITEKTIHLYRSTLGKQKRGCNVCYWNNYCVKPCWTAILFDNFGISQCSLYRIYQYIKSNKSVVADFEKYLLECEKKDVRT